MYPRFVVRDIALTERPVAFRRPFRFGGVTFETTPEVIVHAIPEFEDGRRATGAAERMAPPWINKNAAPSPDLVGRSAGETRSDTAKGYGT
ncbi:MAG: hypothetical protein K8H87_07000 [Pseudorhodoplanes sp.]|nr:hypothetical protein [Pseudorhodoplanes sp.]